MSKRKRQRMRRAHLKRFASDFINVTKAPNPDKIAELHQTVRSTRGPKTNMEPVMENSFTRPMENGEAGRWWCICGRGPFWTTIAYQQHLKRLPKNEVFNPDNHDPIFQPDSDRRRDLDRTRDPGYTDPESGEYIKAHVQDVLQGDMPRFHARAAAHNYRLWDGPRHTGFAEWHWQYVAAVKDVEYWLGFYGAEWVYRKVYADRMEYTIGYASRELAELYFSLHKLTWDSSKTEKR